MEATDPIATGYFYRSNEICVIHGINDAQMRDAAGRWPGQDVLKFCQQGTWAYSSMLKVGTTGSPRTSAALASISALLFSTSKDTLT